MPTIKEFREFFLRAVKTQGGTKPDKEAGYPVEHIINGKKFYNRFLKGHIPSENTIKKLFESLTFKLNKEDTASLDVQGLAKKTNDQDAINRVSGSDFTSFIQPHQLPEIILELDPFTDTAGISEYVEGLLVTPVTRVLGGESRLCYLIQLSEFPQVFQNMFSNVLVTPIVPTIIDVLTIEAGTLAVSDSFDIILHVGTDGIGGTGTYKLILGGTNADFVGVDIANGSLGVADDWTFKVKVSFTAAGYYTTVEQRPNDNLTPAYGTYFTGVLITPLEDVNYLKLVMDNQSGADATKVIHYSVEYKPKLS